MEDVKLFAEYYRKGEGELKMTKSDLESFACTENLFARMPEVYGQSATIPTSCVSVRNFYIQSFSLTECILIVRIRNTGVVCLSVCVSVCVCVCVFVCVCESVCLS